MKITITSEIYSRFLDIYTGYTEINGKTLFLGKVITTDVETARNVFEKALSEIVNTEPETKEAGDLDYSTLEIKKCWHGYEIQAVDPDAPKFHMYIQKVYKGRATWVTDYTHAKSYKTEKAARDVIEKIRAGVIVNDL